MDTETGAELGEVQRTLFFPLLGRARESERKRPLLRDPKAVELVRAIDFDTATYNQGAASFIVVIRTMILDWWVSQFLARHPDGTVVELGTGLNTRFERTDNGRVHWVDLDLPDTIELRRRFFADTRRRTMVAASLLDEDWLAEVERRPGPYFFVSDGVLVYLREEQVTGALARIAARFPGARLAFDTYPRVDLQRRAPDGCQAGLRRVAVAVRRPALAGAARPAPHRDRERDPAARRAAGHAARPVPLPAAAGQPGAQPGLHGQPVRGAVPAPRPGRDRGPQNRVGGPAGTGSGSGSTPGSRARASA